MLIKCHIFAFVICLLEQNLRKLSVIQNYHRVQPPQGVFEDINTKLIYSNYNIILTNLCCKLVCMWTLTHCLCAWVCVLVRVCVCVCVYTCASVQAHQSTWSQSMLPVGLIPSHPEKNKTHSFSHLASHVKYYVTRSEPGPLTKH